MISIIVCSRYLQLFNNLSANIEKTIGVPHEIICIDNSNNAYSLCKAYNMGAAQAKFSLLCFVHEDVVFKTLGWGRNFVNHFSQSDIGLIGVAGAVHKSKMCSGWWQSEDNLFEIRRMNIQQSTPHLSHLFINPFEEKRSEVVLIDGVFIGTTKATWLHHKFDEELFTGFHGYDLDFSFSVSQSKKIFVVYDILIEHFSTGSTGIEWMMGMMKLHKKWKKKLPFKSVQYEINPALIYEYGWMRLRKNITQLMGYERGKLFFISSYNSLFSLLDCKPNFLILYKDYLVQLLKMSRVFFNANSSHKKKYSATNIVYPKAEANAVD